MAGNSADAMRYLATVKRQSAPPRCNPFTIVLQVLALGMVFIGLTMTIIAHWPGSTSIGENPLKIAGPILLAVGFALFLLGVILVCCLNKKERTRWERMIHKYAATSRQQGDNSFPPPKSNYDDPNGGAVAAPLLSSQRPENPTDSSQLPPGKGYNQDPYYDGGRGRPGGYPYPGDGNGPESSFTMDEDDGIPDPVREKKKRRPKPPGAGSHEDLSGEFVTTKTEVTTVTTKVVKRTGDGEPTVEETTKTTRTKQKSKGAEPGMGYDDDGQGYLGDGGAAARPGGRGLPGTQPSPSPGEQRRLKVHVKAQPGATVHIHPSAPPVAPKPAFSTYSHSTASGDTDV